MDDRLERGERSPITEAVLVVDDVLGDFGVFGALASGGADEAHVFWQEGAQAAHEVYEHAADDVF